MSSPSKPLAIGSPRGRDSTPGAASETTPPLGTPDNRALRAAYIGTPPVPNIPPRGGTPRLGSDSPSSNNLALPTIGSSTDIINSFASRTGSTFGGRRPATPGSPSAVSIDIDDLPEEEKARILRRHLVPGADRRLDKKPSTDVGFPSSSGGSTPRGGPSRGEPEQDTDVFPVPYHTPGADIVHDIYKWPNPRGVRPRASSYAGTEAAPDSTFQYIHEPGGFRRNYLLRRANEQGAERPRILNSFIDFLYIFGHFAGEDLEDDEDDDKDEVTSGAGPSETQPLLTGHRSLSAASRHRRRQMSSTEHHGDATNTEAVLMLLKAFVGTGVLFLGKAFMNGGLLFSAITLAAIALISLFSFILLVKTKFVVSGSFGDIGGKFFGPWMRYAILTSIAVSQLGFAAAYIIFIAENLQAFVLAVSHCAHHFSVGTFIAIQALVVFPLALVRNIAKLSTTALIADAFILVGLAYIFSSEFSIIAKNGIANVKLFNERDFPLFVGTAVFSFEGIGLVIPITDSMRKPHDFPKVLTGVMVFLMFLFGGAGALAYLTFGSDIQTTVIVNLDMDSKAVQTIQFLYSMAILLSVPLQLFPAIRIMENGLFVRSGKGNPSVKWLKNGFRFFTVIIVAVLSWVGAADLDKFVSFVGSFACVPLCFIYPAMLHYKAVAKTRWQKTADILMMVFGALAAVYTTVQTVRLMLAPGGGGAPKLGNCDV